MQGILADALKCLGDNKKVVREAVIKMLDSWVLLLQLDKMVCTSFNNSEFMLSLCHNNVLPITAYEMLSSTV